jgi:glycosyltransferase involved in cell wall biosynthesis
VRRPRRILYFNTWSTAHGGSATSLIDITRNLDRTKFEPLVLCPEQGDLTVRLTEAGVPVVIHPLSSLRLGEARRFAAETFWYARLLRREAIALVHGNTGGSRRSIVLASWLCGVPYVQHVRNPVKDARNGFAFRVASRIVTNSDSIAAPLRSDALFEHKTMTVYNAVDLSQYEQADDRRAELRCGSRPVIGFVGQLVPRKGLDTLFRAMPKILCSQPDALLVIVGCAPQGEPGYETECRRLAAQLGIEQHVHFTGYRRDVPAWMRTFTVFALPTRSEPFGKVVIEAMAAGCPVVVSHVGGIPEIVREPGLGTLIPPDDPERLAEEVLKYLNDRDLARRVGENASGQVRERFSMRAMIGQLESLYESLIPAQRH